MKIEDRIYGVEEIQENVLVDLINSPKVQRLKNISQLGMPDKYLNRKGYSRYEHSIGVMVLLRKLNAILEEQITGLLHDVSHTAFSHVIDWVIGNPEKEDYQDNVHKNVIENSELPRILKKYNFDFKKISEPENYNLLERPTPCLCADRIDYSLRELFMNKKSKIAKKIFENLINYGNQIIFGEEKIATIFAREYSEMQSEIWAGDQARTRYYILSDILKRSLSNKLISLEDLNQDDFFILDILENSRDNYVLDKLNLLKKGFDIVDDEKGIELKKKFRFIDPEVLFNNSYKPLSEISKEYADFLEKEKEKSLLIKKVKIIPF